MSTEASTLLAHRRAYLCGVEGFSVCCTRFSAPKRNSNTDHGSAALTTTCLHQTLPSRLRTPQESALNQPASRTEHLQRTKCRSVEHYLLPVA